MQKPKGLGITIETGFKDINGKPTRVEDHMSIYVCQDAIKVYCVKSSYDGDWQANAEKVVRQVEAVIKGNFPPSEMDSRLMAIEGMERLRDDIEWDRIH